MATDKEIYGKIAYELKNRKVVPALYAKAVELAEGDKTKLESIYIRLRATDLKSQRRTANVAAAAKNTSDAIDKARPTVGLLYPKIANGLPKLGLRLGALWAGLFIVGYMFFENLSFQIPVVAVSIILLWSVGGWLAGKAVCLIGTTFVLARDYGFYKALVQALSRVLSFKRCESPYEPMPRIQDTRRLPHR